MRHIQTELMRSAVGLYADRMAKGSVLDMDHVLIVDDEIMLREMAAEALTDAGFAVFQASDGREALALLWANPSTKILVSDIRMPGMDGYALAEACLQSRPDLTILLMTGHATELGTRKTERHAIEVLQKPFSLKELCERVHEMAGDFRRVQRRATAQNSIFSRSDGKRPDG